MKAQLALAVGVCIAALGCVVPASTGADTPNPTQAENTRPGTTAWQRAAEITDGSVELYASEVSVLPGEVIHLHVGVRPSQGYRLEVYRLGWYGGLGGRLLGCIPDCAGAKNGVPRPRPGIGTDGLIQAGWPVTDEFTVPADTASGYLMIRAVGARSTVAATTYVIVREAAARHSAILVQVPTNTWQAYNGWGGLSTYAFDYSKGRRAAKVSFDRPYAWTIQGGQSPLVWELQTLRFLERQGYDVSYQTDQDTDAHPESLLQHRLVLVIGHDEYWTKSMFDGWEAARAAGTNLAFMGANAAYWQVRYEDGGRTMVAYKSMTDPVADPELKTVRFRELSPPRYECELIGIQHQEGSLNWPVGDYAAQAPALSDPWFTGAGFQPGDTLPGLVSRETDTIPGNQSPASSCSHELTVFFHRERGGDSQGNADAIRYVAPSGARVFAAGSLQLAWGLDAFRGPGSESGAAAAESPKLERFMANALADLTRPAEPVTVTATGSRRGVALTAALHADPRVTAVQYLREPGDAVACVGSPSCRDQPPGHRRWTYEAQAVDAWGTSAPVASGPVWVPNSPPSVGLAGPRFAHAGRRYVFRATISDRDGDSSQLGWSVSGGALVRDRGSRAVVVFRQPGTAHVTVTADDGHRRGRSAAQLAVGVH